MRSDVFLFFATAMIALPLTPNAADQTDDRLVLLGASYGKNVLAICDRKGEVLWKLGTEGPRSGHAGHHDIHLLDDGNILFHDSWTKIKEMDLQGKVVWEYDSGTENGNEGKPVDVHAFARLPNGDTVIVESGRGRIIHVNREKKITREIALGDGGRKKTRLMTMTPQGYYLVCAENPGVVTEYDPEGRIVWEYETGARVFGALRLKNGNTLICTGNGNSVIEVNPGREVVWSLAKTIPGTTITLGWMTDLQELPDGNLVLGNCHAGEAQPQMVEVTRDKKVAWTFQQWDLAGNGLACWQILTPEQSQMVRKKLAARAGN